MSELVSIVNNGSISVIAGGILGFISQHIQNRKEIKQAELEITERKNQRDHEILMHDVPDEIRKVDINKINDETGVLPPDQPNGITKPFIVFYTLGLLTFILYNILPAIDRLDLNQLFEIFLIILNIISFIIGKSIGWFFGAKQKTKT